MAGFILSQPDDKKQDLAGPMESPVEPPGLSAEEWLLLWRYIQKIDELAKLTAWELANERPGGEE